MYIPEKVYSYEQASSFILQSKLKSNKKENFFKRFLKKFSK